MVDVPRGKWWFEEWNGTIGWRGMALLYEGLEERSDWDVGLVTRYQTL